MIDLELYAAGCGIDIIRNAPVENVGLLLDRRMSILAPFYDGRYLAELERNKGISMVLTTDELLPMVPADRGAAVCEDPKDTLYTLHGLLLEAGHYGVCAANEIAPNVRIHPSACIAERGVRIGAGTIVGPKAVIEERSVIGEDCVIGTGVVIGGYGFEIRRIGGMQTVVPHAGGVRLGSRVFIQSNAVVDRALFGGFTEIGDETVVDDLVHISHGVSIGKRCRIVACSAVCGASVLGDDVWIGPNATVSSTVHVGDGARVSLGSVVIRDVPAGACVSGNFAIDHERFMSLFKASRRE
jgi:UDP-3-O-[3-hydroxymyristoyl] glucosamine N-acyltransferase LpxD